MDILLKHLGGSCHAPLQKAYVDRELSVRVQKTSALEPLLRAAGHRNQPGTKASPRTGRQYFRIELFADVEEWLPVVMFL